MYTTTLVADRVKEGAKLLVEMDNRGLNPEVVFWTRTPDDERWNLVIASSVVGRWPWAKVVKKLYESFAFADVRTFSANDCIVAGLEDVAFRSLYRPFAGSGRIDEKHPIDFADAYIYRDQLPAATRAKLRR
jgi:hypothetical protein